VDDLLTGWKQSKTLLPKELVNAPTSQSLGLLSAAYGAWAEDKMTAFVTYIKPAQYHRRRHHRRRWMWSKRAVPIARGVFVCY